MLVTIVLDARFPHGYRRLETASFCSSGNLLASDFALLAIEMSIHLIGDRKQYNEALKYEIEIHC